MKVLFLQTTTLVILVTPRPVCIILCGLHPSHSPSDATGGGGGRGMTEFLPPVSNDAARHRDPMGPENEFPSKRI